MHADMCVAGKANEFLSYSSSFELLRTSVGVFSRASRELSFSIMVAEKALATEQKLETG